MTSSFRNKLTHRSTIRPPMKNIARSSLVTAAVILTSCSSIPYVGDLSPQAARIQAQRDYAAGHPQIYKWGGYAACEPGIEDDQKILVEHLPRNGSLAGCTNPKVRYSVGFATAYNQEIISLIRHSRLR